MSLTSGDRRIQTIFTHDPSSPAVFGAGVQRALESLDLPMLAWEEATAERFDLAVAASENDRLEALDAPVCLVPHGVGYQKFYPNSQVISGLNPDRLVVGGRVVPAAIAVSHPDHLARLRAACPTAAERGVVVGDPCLARMLASRHREEWYRAGFGARDKALVVLASTWGPESLLGRWPQLPDHLVAQLPVDEYQVAMVAHPGIWAAHGPWQMRAWLSRAADCGLRIVPPGEGWQAALVGASVVLSDHGSMALYAAALGKPLLMAVRNSSTTVPGSALAALAAAATALERDESLRQQVDRAIAGHVAPVVSVVARSMMTDSPHRCAARLRTVLYDLLRLTEPDEEAEFAPVTVPDATPVPDAAPGTIGALVVGAQVAADGVRLERYPDRGRGRPHDHLHYRHIVANTRYARIGQLAGASILTTGYEATGYEGYHDRWLRHADVELSRWPQATMVATALDGQRCLIRTRTTVVSLRTDGATAADPLLLASLAYARLAATGRVLEQDRLWLGGRAISVVAVAG